ncbi:site-specific integrase [Geodermatophilus sp. DSM 45219]|uniref:tyrosine-type recombinase/integrase n=1 Tax=Geodermatophilus sp. DSM 45219 TaxID=1881103 RepID=UPI000886128C|nr:site-specific integrase [Geodermatophilus sp. DSM 45219]SDO01789.1 Site-specific recombinase XerD [Geodermatophilus sp. DSM 45219]
MASVEKRVTDGRTTYQARWRDERGRQRKKSFAKKADADRHAATVEADKARGTYIEPSKVTVAEYAREWAAARPHRPTTARRTEMMIRLHIEGTRLGRRRLADVRSSEVQAWATDRSTVLAPTTVRQALGLLRSVYAAAVLDRLVASSPVVRIRLPRYERPRVVPLTVDQVAALAEAMPARYRAMVLAQAGLGLRIGELLALRVQDIDFLRRTVRVEWQFTQASNGQRTEPKTPRSRRSVPLPGVVADALAAHLAAYEPAADGTVFTTGAGTPPGHVYYGHNLIRRAVTRAGLPPGTTSHDLRHHYASVLLAGGESVVAVAERLGHEDASLVLSTYGHLMPDSDDRTRTAVDTAWNRAESCAPDVPRPGDRPASRPARR